MSAFSRGCLLRHQCAYSPRIIRIFLPPTTPRFFATTSLLQAKKKSRPPPTATKPRPPPATKTQSSLPSKPSFTPTKASPTTAISNTNSIYSTYASTFARKSHSTLLYEAPSHTAFIASNYATAFFCYSWAVFNYWGNYLYAPAGLAEWVPPAYLSISVLMAGGGTYLALNSANLIRSITAIPPKATTGGDGVLDPRVVGKGGSEEELKIEIILRKMFPIPFFPARKLYIKPEDIVLPQQIAAPLPTLSREEMRAIRLEEEARRKQELEYERSHLLTSPFRHMNRAFFNAFRGIRRTWMRDGFVKVEVKGKMYKMDVHGGWAMDGGKVLDRLVKVRHRL